MTCPQGHWIPATKLTCPDCAIKRIAMGMRDLQLEFLHKAMDGGYSYPLRVAKGNERHVLMYTSFVHTFCGRELKTKPQIKYESFSDDTLSKICAGCRVEIRRLLQEDQ